jgi:hypothetical protein
MVVYRHSLNRNMHMSILAKQLFAASRADVGLEHIVAEVTSSYGAPLVQTDDFIAAEISDTPEFDKLHSPIENITQLVAAAADASDATKVVEQATQVREGVQDLREDVEQANKEAGGVSVESYPYVVIAMQRYGLRAGMEYDAPTAPALESATTSGRILVDVSSLEAIEERLDAAMPMFMRESQSTFETMCDAIRAALPDARERLTTLLTDLQMDNTPLTGSVSVPGEVLSALSVNGQIPDDLVTYLANYVSMGKALSGEYMTRASASAEQLAGLLGSLNYTSPDGFWDTLAAVVEKVGDPRKALGQDVLATALPGSVPLFGAASEATADGNPTMVQLARYVSDYAPVVGTETEGNEAPASEASVPSYSREQLRVLIKSVLELLCDESVECVLKAAAHNWQITSAAVAETTQTVRSITGDVQQALGLQLEIIPRWVRTVHQLSVWPPVNFLTNLVFTSNALALLGSEMVLGERAAEPEPAADPTDPNAAPDTAPTDPSDPTADPALDAGVDGVVDEVQGDASATDPSQVPPMEPDPPADPADPLNQPDAVPPTNPEDAPASDASADGAPDAGADDTANPEAHPDESALDGADATPATDESAPAADDDTKPDDDEDEGVDTNPPTTA